MSDIMDKCEPEYASCSAYSMPLTCVMTVVVGVFDGLHAGHLLLLREAQRLAKAAGSPLALLLNSDKSLAGLKRGAQHTMMQRAALLRAICPEAEVFFFHHTLPCDALRELFSRCHHGFIQVVKGDEYVDQDTPEKALPFVVMRYVRIIAGRMAGKLSTRVPVRT